MGKNIKIRRGFDIKLKGEAEKRVTPLPVAQTYAIKPTDFHGLTPKLAVKEGDQVKAGSTIFYDKYNEIIKFTSPVSGKVTAIKRGEKRKLLEVVILADKETIYLNFPKSDPTSLGREDVIKQLMDSGVWPLIRQRPYTVVADPSEKPKSIFISGFNSNPLGPDNGFIMQGYNDLLQIGINALRKLTEGKVHLNLKDGASGNEFFQKLSGVEQNKFSGPHPAGNVGVQIHHIDPLNKGERIWYVDIQTVLTIGSLFKEGRYDATRVVAFTGSQVNSPSYYKTLIGAPVKSILDQGVNTGDNRVISGNVLSGTHIEETGYIGFYDDQVTVIEEGKTPDFFGWLIPNLKKLSVSRTFLSWLTPNKQYSLNTSLNGEGRAFVMSGEYDKVFPMDILPVQLLKASLINDIEAMENLGIYEVAPEDFALCEFVCTSKIDSQTIIRKGLDLIKQECG